MELYEITRRNDQVTITDQQKHIVLELAETEFMALAETAYAEYCRIRRASGQSVELPGGKRSRGYFLGYEPFSYLRNTMFLKTFERQALRRLLAFKGTRQDLEIALKIAERNNQRGLAAMLRISLEEA